MIENPVVLDSHWRHQEEPKVIGCCEGCGDDVFIGQEIYDFDGGLVHQNASCCMDYVANMSICKVAGE